MFLWGPRENSSKSTFSYRTPVQYRCKGGLLQAGSGSGLLTRPASATKGLPVLDRRRVPFLPWNLSEEKKKKLVKAGLPHGDDTSEIDRALHPVTRIHKVDGA
jgi:hypothetical protein